MLMEETSIKIGLQQLYSGQEFRLYDHHEVASSFCPIPV